MKSLIGRQAAFTYDAGLVALEAMRRAGTAREAIRDTLAAINSPSGAVPGVTGSNYFNHHGDMLKPPAISRVVNGRLLSTLTQLQIPHR